jgi:Polyketide cyclase / dehydrase and lipid transport
MIEHQFQTTVARSPEEAFDFLVDLRNAPQWEPYCRAVEKTSEGPIGEGTTFQEDMTWGRKEAKVASFERPAGFATQERARGTDCGVEFRFETKPGGTQVRGRLWMQQHGVLRLLEPLMLLRVRRPLGEVPERLRRGIESSR